MKNYIQPGNSIDIVVGVTGIVSGQGYIAGGSLFGYAVASGLQGDLVAIQVEGVVEAAKLASDNLTLGQKVNFNDATGELQAAAGTLDGVATVVEAADNTKSTVKVKLTPL